ncbi:MurR/RpiR family transcriptional regulator [Mesorhizobium sp. B4-1-4]|uniref:MurR/RpiR family transcriptional regulator n=1 Tax=Mesorhizobium sp. B4-1-4 TaxID=2589888 RepID=UPI00112CEDAD|nr:MurR/RpiR family transcriptional regulator [Mesorhizobium sp. B4-1-4]UCI31909.1 MurR/RpiR family transcriptional regulator [Mesorhizobium sp. B4-1-4]
MDKADIHSALLSLASEVGGHMAVAANYLVARPDDVAVHSMRDIAKYADVPPVTLVRLAQRLGLQGYGELRQRYIDAILEETGQGSHAARRNVESARAIVASTKGEHGVADFAAAFFKAESVLLQRASADLSAEKLSRVAELLANAPKAFVVGRRTCFPPAVTLAYALRKARPNVILLDDFSGAPEAQLDDVAAGDVLLAFTFAPFSRVTDMLVRKAVKSGAILIAVSDSAAAPLQNLTEGLLFLTPTISRAFPESAAGATALANLFAALTVAKLGGVAHERIRNNEEFLVGSGEYLRARVRTRQKTSTRGR